MPPKPPIKLPRRPPQAPKPYVPYTPPPKPIAAAAAPPPPPPPPPPKPSLLKRPIQILSGFVVLFFIRDKIVSFDTVRGSSMAPTLSPHAHEQGKSDMVIIRKVRQGELIASQRQVIQRGDIITFWKPHKENEVSIKRVVAVEGDLVWVKRGYGVGPRGKRLGIADGLEDEDGLVGELDHGDEGGEGEGRIVVPYHHVWVEGDNWRKSYDSNDFGPVSLALVDGKAVRVWRDGWWRKIEDGREAGRGSRVVEGVGMLPPARWRDG